jgi:hypothetical protein
MATQSTLPINKEIVDQIPPYCSDPNCTSCKELREGYADGHPTAHRVYTWAHDTDDPSNPRRQVTVLHTDSIKSAHDAVKAAIVQEFRKLGTAEES